MKVIALAILSVGLAIDSTWYRTLPEYSAIPLLLEQGVSIIAAIMVLFSKE